MIRLRHRSGDSERPEFSVERLLDFLKKLKSPEKLKGHSLLDTGEMELLIADYLHRYPQHQHLPTERLAAWALAELLDREMLPGDFSDRHLDEWTPYFTLKVLFFASFSWARRLDGKDAGHLQTLTLEQAAGQLPNDEHLQALLLDVFQGLKLPHSSDAVRELCEAFAPPSSGEIEIPLRPASTIQNWRDGALRKMVGIIESIARDLAAAEGRAEPRQPPFVESDAKVSSPAESPMASQSETEENGETPPATDPPAVDASASVIDSTRMSARMLAQAIHQRLVQALIPGEWVGVASKSHRLLQELAVITEGLESTGEPTKRLTPPNVQRALRATGFETGREPAAERLVALSEKARFLKRDVMDLDYLEPGLTPFLAAERIAEQTPYRVSLRPSDFEIMQWVARLLANRGEESSNYIFCESLRRDLAANCDLSALDALRLLIAFDGRHTDSTARLMEQVMQHVRSLVVRSVPSGRLQKELVQCSQEAGISLDPFPVSLPPEQLLLPPELEAIRQGTHIAALCEQLGLPELAKNHRDVWHQHRRVLTALLSRLRCTTDDRLRFQSAAWLQTMDLTRRLPPSFSWQKPWEVRLPMAFDVLADLVIDLTVAESVRMAAMSALSADAHILSLLARGNQHTAIAYTLLLAQGKRARVNSTTQWWEIVE